MTEDLGQISEISFRVKIDEKNPRPKEMKRGSEGLFIVGMDGEEKEYYLKIKSRYTMKDGTIQYKCIIPPQEDN